MQKEAFRYAPRFEERLVLQKIFEEKAEQAGKEYPYQCYFGEYGPVLESLITSLTKKLLEIKKEPVIVMDVGGGIGGSWLDIASSFNKDIHDGRLAFVVSNLMTKPEELLSKNRLQSEQRNKRIEELKNYRVNPWLFRDEKSILLTKKYLKNRVNYITGSTSNILSKTLALPTGKEIPFLGNVDIIHEHYSITAWGLTPEFDINNLADLMSLYSTYFVPEQDILSRQGSSDTSRSGYSNDIKKGISLTHQMLQKELGLIRCVLKPDMAHNYVVFRKPNSPTSKDQMEKLLSARFY